MLPPCHHQKQLYKGQSFLEHENGFQVGMRLEGVGPRRPSVFCVLSVAKVWGYRLRLHFDGDLSCYDFWTNAGSPDIHPVGWCEKTKHELRIPKAPNLAIVIVFRIPKASDSDSCEIYSDQLLLFARPLLSLVLWEAKPKSNRTDCRSRYIVSNAPVQLTGHDCNHRVPRTTNPAMHS
ncbi:hypothetical protein ACRRTK_024957 [Alexandromys fortis]